jgi:hypothetical protein
MYLQMHVFALTINVSSDFRPKGRKGFALLNSLTNSQVEQISLAVIDCTHFKRKRLLLYSLHRLYIMAEVL